MPRTAMTIYVLVVLIFSMTGQNHSIVVADSTTRTPLPSASIFNHKGLIVGICNSKGRTPYISTTSYPITVRYLGFKEKTVTMPPPDTIFLQENQTELPEIVVKSRQHKIIHMLAYMREYSMLTTYADTIFLFREKMVDYMLPAEKNTRFNGWSSPRVLKSNSYYHFTNSHGLDSVSDKCNHHFSWSDWIGIAPTPEVPQCLVNVEHGVDTIQGKYSPTEIWIRNNGKMAVDVNVLADTTSRKWVPNLSAFFRHHLDFDCFKIRFNYDNLAGASISPMDLTGYSYNIESKGRGHDMFMFHRVNDPFFVSTYAEIYVIDKEYIPNKEAKKWERLQIKTADIEIYEPSEAPELQPSIQQLVSRVNSVDRAKVRSTIVPDRRLVGRGVVKQNLGQRVLQLFKTITGISSIKARRAWNNQWKDFKRKRIESNNQHPEENDQ